MAAGALGHEPGQLCTETEFDQNGQQRRIRQRDGELAEARRAEIGRLGDGEQDRRDPHERLRTGKDRHAPRDAPEQIHGVRRMPPLVMAGAVPPGMRRLRGTRPGRSSCGCR